MKLIEKLIETLNAEEADFLGSRLLRRESILRI